MPERVKRLRVFAGPNGSGKSTVGFYILEHYYGGPFINADELHKELVQKGIIDLSKFQVTFPDSAFAEYITNEGKSWIEKTQEDGIESKLIYTNHTLTVQNKLGVYDAAIAADFLRYFLIKNGETFTFETVLSDKRKASFLQEARHAGYQIYLYFICTVDPEINKIRVINRVKKGGHPVPPEKIETRYYHSLEVLSEVIPFTHRCFLFDNSDDSNENEINLVADIEDGKKLVIHSDNVPWWIEQYVIKKLF